MQNIDRRENPTTLRKKLYAVVGQADTKLLRKLLTLALCELHEVHNTDRRENPTTLRKKLYAVISRADARLLRKLLTFALRELHEEDDEGE